MILLFLILVIVIALLLFRSQSYRQHREMMSAVNPEKLRQIDNRQRAHNRVLFIIVGIPIAIIILMAIYYQLGGH